MGINYKEAFFNTVVMILRDLLDRGYIIDMEHEPSCPALQAWDVTDICTCNPDLRTNTRQYIESFLTDLDAAAKKAGEENDESVIESEAEKAIGE